MVWFERGARVDVADFEPTVGDVLGERYEVLAEIGRGGMATVYRGRDLRLGRTVALKVFRPGIAEAVDPRRTSQETQLLAGLDHPSVVGVLDAANEGGPFGTYLVMELVHGVDLGTALHRARGPLPADIARRITADIAGALAALHDHGMVHRDVKPANVLVVAGATAQHSGVVAKLTDFGIAQMVDATRITAPESILGTAAYLSPEQVRGARPRPSSDVYALGLVLLECLTGERAYPGSAVESAVARLTRPPALPADASPALADLLSRMTALDPASRPKAAEVEAALRSSLVGAVTAPDATATAVVPGAALAGAAAALPSRAADATAALPRIGTVPVLTGPTMVIDPTPSGAQRLGIASADAPSDARRRLAAALGVAASTVAVLAAGAVVAAVSGLSPAAPAGNARAEGRAVSSAAVGAPAASARVGVAADVAGGYLRNGTGGTTPAASVLRSPGTGAVLPGGSAGTTRGDATATGTGTRSASADPTGSGITSSDPTSSQPVSDDPTSSEPTSSEPTSSEPASSDPASSDPASSEPTSTDPGSSDPAPSDPAPSDATSTDSGSTSATSSDSTSPSDEAPSADAEKRGAGSGHAGGKSAPGRGR